MFSFQHNQRGLSCFAVSIAFNILALLFIAARLYTRIRITKTPGADDVLIVISWIFSAAFMVTIGIRMLFPLHPSLLSNCSTNDPAAEAGYGMGLNVEELTGPDIVNFIKAFWVSLWTYNLSLTLTKLSILVQYLRIFVTPRFQIACKCMIGVIVIYGLWTVFGMTSHWSSHCSLLTSRSRMHVHVLARTILLGQVTHWQMHE